MGWIKCKTMTPGRFFLSGVFCLVLLAGCAAPEPPPPSGSPRMAHTSPSAVVALHPIPLSVTVNSGGNIDLVRVYFRKIRTQSFYLLPLKRETSTKYMVTLPPAKNGSRGIDYRILLREEGSAPLVSRVYRLLVTDSIENAPESPAPLDVQTEDSDRTGISHDFLVPLNVTLSKEPLLKEATAYSHDPITVPGPASRKRSTPLNGPGSVFFSVEIGGAALRVGSGGL